ncbi:hypothetical protein [Chryseobacterium populi]|uniref:Uncharacterized protein n=1 Tax=Chryseobacterium populi TaxID=1144316 RepID=J2K4D2_9FLAO|nr:hypothetical protein [Chryseobacterium populi]EJL68098.1 hypothetical protein PMI13_03853 [Chryseobacterium populi]
MKNIFFIFSSIICINCSNNESTKKNSNVDYSFDNILGYQDTLFIKSRFADCGEWGGHNELIKIYSFENKMKLTYTTYKIDCGVRDKSGSITQVENSIKNKFLSHDDKSSLMKYINNLMKYKFIRNEFGNSGNTFSIEDSKGQLKLSQYGNNGSLLTNYNDLMKNLGFPNVIVKNN